MMYRFEKNNARMTTDSTKKTQKIATKKTRTMATNTAKMKRKRKNIDDDGDYYFDMIESINNLLFEYCSASISYPTSASTKAFSSISSKSSSSTSCIFIILFIHLSIILLNPFIFIPVNASTTNGQQGPKHLNSSMPSKTIDGVLGHHQYLNSKTSNSNIGQFSHPNINSVHQSKQHYHPQQQKHSPSISRSYLPTIDGRQIKLIPQPTSPASPPTTNNDDVFQSFGSCTSPEVMVNGSPSPDIAGTVSGGQLGSIEEIQFVGVVSGGHQLPNNHNQNPNAKENGSSAIKQKRVCKIKCLNGVWIGPLCAFQNVDEYEPVVRPCRVPNIANGSVVVMVDGKSNNATTTAKNSMFWMKQNDESRSSSKIKTTLKELPHGSIIKVKCKEIGLFKLSTNGVDGAASDTLQCVDGLWDNAQIPYCQPTTLHMNFSLTSPPSILYTLLDGTLGINDDDRQQQLVILPGAIVHLDCVFQETFGQPQWSVSNLPDLSPTTSGSSIDPTTDGDDSNSVHHQVFDYTEQKQQQQQHQFLHNTYQSSSSSSQYIGNQHLSHRRRGYHHRKHHQQQPGSNQDVKTHTTGWAILTDKQSWKYRLAIYYASESDTGRYTCTTPNGQTNYIDIVVKDVQCPSLEEMTAADGQSQDPNRLASKTGLRMHDRIRFSCLNGYHLRGRREVKCMPNGQWSHPFPTCQEISCPDYGIIDGLDPNLFVTYVKPNEAELQEEDSFNIDGGVGGHSGSSSSGDQDSRILDPINSQSFSAEYWHNSSRRYNDYNNDRQALSFRCPLGYRLLGASLIICNEQNQWSEPFPKCQQLTCQEPELPKNVQIMKSTNGRYLIGDYIQFGCHKGYKMFGQDVATCLPNEHWSSPPPICKQVCSYPAKLMHGFYDPVKFHYDIGEMVSIHCDRGYRLVKEFDDGQEPSSMQTMCGSDGIWIGPAVKCKRLTANNRHHFKQR